MEKLGRELAKAYMAAYSEAMARTFRPDFAGQVAMMVTVAIANRPQPAAGEDLFQKTFKMILKPDQDLKKKDPKDNPDYPGDPAEDAPKKKPSRRRKKGGESDEQGV